MKKRYFSRTHTLKRQRTIFTGVATAPKALRVDKKNEDVPAKRDGMILREEQYHRTLIRSIGLDSVSHRVTNDLRYEHKRRLT